MLQGKDYGMEGKVLSQSTCILIIKSGISYVSKFAPSY